MNRLGRLNALEPDAAQPLPLLDAGLIELLALCEHGIEFIF
jgi:hypothetical protein